MMPRLSLLEAHALCLALVAADLAARTLRIRWLVGGLGTRISLFDGLVINGFADAGSGLTPLRLGGEPARVAAMLRSGVPAPAVFVAIGLEVLIAWPTLLVVGGLLFYFLAPDWWSDAAPTFADRVGRAWPWAVAVAIVSVGAWRLARRRATHTASQLRHPFRRACVYLRRMPAWPLIASVPLSAVNVIARVALLPILALTLPDPPTAGAVWIGSFALIYSQLILPTPSGAGAVDLGFLAGAAGNLDAGLLVAWRLYANGVGAILGVWLAVHIYGWPALRALVRRAVGRPSGQAA